MLVTVMVLGRPSCLMYSSATCIPEARSYAVARLPSQIQMPMLAWTRKTSSGSRARRGTFPSASSLKEREPLASEIRHKRIEEESRRSSPWSSISNGSSEGRTSSMVPPRVFQKRSSASALTAFPWRDEQILACKRPLRFFSKTLASSPTQRYTTRPVSSTKASPWFMHRASTGMLNALVTRDAWRIMSRRGSYSVGKTLRKPLS
mmetsp:Transcript_19979/g.39245  ORF Transcript_19979/g.39245 Transcript_19979/m.39245 type:complete len:205 (+) Transcript_19979:381-995(+)